MMNIPLVGISYDVAYMHHSKNSVYLKMFTEVINADIERSILSFQNETL